MLNTSRSIIAKVVLALPKFKPDYNHPASQLQQTFQQLRHQSFVQSSNNKKLLNKVAIVTGSTEGIGLSIAKRLAEEGAKVVISSRKKANVDKVVKELQATFPGQIVGTVCHVGKEEDRDHLINFSLEKFGGKIDILVPNAAVNPYLGPFLGMSESQWDKVFEVNLKSPFLLTQKIVPHMLRNEGPGEKGAIVYISSVAAYGGVSKIGAYAVSKTALLGLCRNMSEELAGDGIRVNLVAPGVIETRFSDILRVEKCQDEFWKSRPHLKRHGRADEVSGIVSFLCGPEASYITGENIVVAGGWFSKL